MRVPVNRSNSSLPGASRCAVSRICKLVGAAEITLAARHAERPLREMPGLADGRASANSGQVSSFQVFRVGLGAGASAGGCSGQLPADHRSRLATRAKVVASRWAAARTLDLDADHGD